MEQWNSRQPTHFVVLVMSKQKIADAWMQQEQIYHSNTTHIKVPLTPPCSAIEASQIAQRR